MWNQIGWSWIKYRYYWIYEVINGLVIKNGPDKRVNQSVYHLDGILQYIFYITTSNLEFNSLTRVDINIMYMTSIWIPYDMDLSGGSKCMFGIIDTMVRIKNYPNECNLCGQGGATQSEVGGFYRLSIRGTGLVVYKNIFPMMWDFTLYSFESKSLKESLHLTVVARWASVKNSWTKYRFIFSQWFAPPT